MKLDISSFHFDPNTFFVVSYKVYKFLDQLYQKEIFDLTDLLTKNNSTLHLNVTTRTGQLHFELINGANKKYPLQYKVYLPVKNITADNSYELDKFVEFINSALKELLFHYNIDSKSFDRCLKIAIDEVTTNKSNYELTDHEKASTIVRKPATKEEIKEVMEMLEKVKKELKERRKKKL